MRKNSRTKEFYVNKGFNPNNSMLFHKWIRFVSTFVDIICHFSAIPRSLKGKKYLLFMCTQAFISRLDTVGYSFSTLGVIIRFISSTGFPSSSNRICSDASLNEIYINFRKQINFQTEATSIMNILRLDEYIFLSIISKC